MNELIIRIIMFPKRMKAKIRKLNEFLEMYYKWCREFDRIADEKLNEYLNELNQEK